MLRRLAASRAPLAARPALLSLRRFSSRYDGDVGDALRFDCAFPTSTTLAPRAFRGRVVLVVNAASQCPTAAAQLPALQQLYETYHARGFDIVAVPSNDFEKKEPSGSDAELAMVYTSKDGPFRVTFPIAKKTAVVGDDAHEFFVRVAQRYGRSVAPTWNFDKFLVDAYGDLCAVFPHDTEPLVPQVIEAIEDALADVPDPKDLDADSDSDDDDDSDDSDSDGEGSESDDSSDEEEDEDGHRKQ